MKLELERTIELNINTPDKSTALQHAIGYLSTWGNQPKVRILFNLEEYGEAHYKDIEGNIKFVIGAVLDSKTQTYSFHS